MKTGNEKKEVRNKCREFMLSQKYYNEKRIPGYNHLLGMMEKEEDPEEELEITDREELNNMSDNQ